MDSTFIKALDIKNPQLITIVGAGGKTSIIKILAEEIDKNIIISTTTHIQTLKDLKKEQIISENYGQITSKIVKIREKSSKKIFIGSEVIKKLYDNEYKIKGFSNNFIEKLSLDFPDEYLLIEGDGAKTRSIKTPAPHEPVIPSTTKNLIVVLGMKNFGEIISKNNVFRFERIKKISSSNKIDEELILNLFTLKDSYGSYLDSFENFTAVLNQIDNKNINRFLKIGKKLLKRGLNKVILTNTSRNNPILKILTK